MNGGFLTLRAGRNRRFAAWKGPRLENFDQIHLWGVSFSTFDLGRWGPNKQETQGVAAVNALLSRGMIDHRRITSIRTRWSKKNEEVYEPFIEIFDRKLVLAQEMARRLQLDFTSLSLKIALLTQLRRGRVREPAVSRRRKGQLEEKLRVRPRDRR